MRLAAASSRRSVVIGAAASLAPFASADAQSRSDRAFQGEVLAVLTHRRPEWRAEPGPDVLSVKVGGGELYLGNLHALVRDLSGEAREAEIVSFVETALTNLSAGGDEGRYAVAAPKLRLQIVPEDYLLSAPKLVTRPFLAGLAVGYAIDDDKSYGLVQRPMLDRWQVGSDEIDRRATENAEQAAEAVSVEARTGFGAGLFVVVITSDGYDASRLLTPRFMRRLRAKLKTEAAICAIPNRDALIVWTPDFGGRRDLATRVAQDAQTQPHPLTDALFVASENDVRLATTAEYADHGRAA